MKQPTYVGHNWGVRYWISRFLASPVLPRWTKRLFFYLWIFNAVNLPLLRLSSGKRWGISVPSLGHSGKKQKQPLDLLKSRPASKFVQQVVEFSLLVNSAECALLVSKLRHCCFAWNIEMSPRICLWTVWTFKFIYAGVSDFGSKSTQLMHFSWLSDKCHLILTSQIPVICLTENGPKDWLPWYSLHLQSISTKKYICA